VRKENLREAKADVGEWQQRARHMQPQARAVGVFTHGAAANALARRPEGPQRHQVQRQQRRQADNTVLGQHVQHLVVRVAKAQHHWRRQPRGHATRLLFLVAGLGPARPGALLRHVPRQRPVRQAMTDGGLGLTLLLELLRFAPCDGRALPEFFALE